MLMFFWQFSDCFSGFFFGREFNGADRVLFFAACAENYTVIRFFYDRVLFSQVLFKFIRGKFAVFYAFFIVYYWIPRYFVSMTAMICFFSHSFFIAY